MSVIGIVASIWLGLGLIALAIAVWQELPLALWIIAGPLLGPYSLFWVAAAIATSAGCRPMTMAPLPTRPDGSTSGGSLPRNCGERIRYSRDGPHFEQCPDGGYQSQRLIQHGVMAGRREFNKRASQLQHTSDAVGHLV